MKKILFFLSLSAILASCATDGDSAASRAYSWTEPSLIGSAGSMPLGGGDIGMNVWVEPENNDIYFYLSQSGCFDENNTLLKLGRFHVGWRYRETGDCLPHGDLRQSLCVDEGYMTIQTGSQTICLWADTERPVVHIELSSDGNQHGEVKQTDGSTQTMEIHPELFVEYESWREADRLISKAECQQSSWKWILPEGTMTYADQLSPNRQALPDQPVWFYHQNRDTTVFDYCVTQQRLDAYKDSLYNPLRDRIFGGRVTMDADRQHAQIVLCNQQSSLADWWQQISQTEQQINLLQDRQASRQWWSDYMKRSFIQLPQGTNEPELEQALLNYRLFRYMLGCNAKSEWPTKFNGGLFTFVADSTDSKLSTQQQTLNSQLSTLNSTPDFRKWGGGTHTAQNQRLVYWGMLKSGDTDLMHSQLDYYLRLLQTTELRSRVYWGHEGACYTEQMENFGLPNPAEYGKHPDKKGNGQDPGVENNRWLEYEWDTALEFCQMALEAHRYADMDITPYEPMILSCLRFFDQHYTDCDSLGHKIIFPGSGCETYKIARNPASTVAALTAVCRSYLAYRHNDEVAALLASLPPLPTYEQQGKLCLAPAESWERINNVESPQLYPVWPWRETGVWEKTRTSDTSLYSLALNTYQCDSIALRNRTYIGWKQDNIWAACLGLTDDAYSLTLQKLLTQPYRFPAFWGPGYDWMPDHNWGGSAVIGLEEMLLQEDPVTGELLILPAWPKDKDIHFKLHASGGRIVEVMQKDGKITQKVTKKFGDKK